MDISRFFIDRPRFAAVISIFIFLLGVLAIFSLPISEYPDVAPPQVVVRAQFPGANPRVISETVADAAGGTDQRPGKPVVFRFARPPPTARVTITTTFQHRHRPRSGRDGGAEPHQPRACRACRTSCAR